MAVRLTNGMRSGINNKIVNHTFEKVFTELADRSGKLAIRTYYGKYPSEKKAFQLPIKKIEDIRMLDLPTHWMEYRNYIYVNAGGYNATLHFKVERPFPIKDKGNGNRWGQERLNVTDPVLILDIQKYLNDVEKAAEEKTNLQRKISSFLAAIKTTKELFAEMPELETILGKDYFVEVTPTTALTTTAKEILCVVAKIREEDREGCCDGKLVEG